VVPKWAESAAFATRIWPNPLARGEDSRLTATKPICGFRDGAIIPLGKVVQSTTEESLDPLTLADRARPVGRAQGELYEDAGEGYGYRSGDYLLSQYQAEQTGRTVTVRATGSGLRAGRGARSRSS